MSVGGRVEFGTLGPGSAPDLPPRDILGVQENNPGQVTGVVWIFTLSQRAERRGLPAAATATTTTATATAATTAAATAAFTGLGFVDRQVATVNVLAIEGCDGCAAVLGVGELNEAEAAGAAGFAVHDERG